MSSLGYVVVRPSIREALNDTLKTYKVVADNLSQRSRVTGAAISRFRWGQCELTTSSLDRILQNLSIHQYLYFVNTLSDWSNQDTVDCLIEDAIQKVPFLSPDLTKSNCLESGLLRAVILHFARSCSTTQFHELLCALAEVRQGEWGTCQSAALTFYPGRPSIREALNIVIEDHKLKVGELGRRAQTPISNFSTYRGYLRELTTKKIDLIFSALPPDSFFYLMAILKGGHRLLEAIEPSLADERLQDIDFMYKVLKKLVMNVAQYCDSEQYEDLLCLIAEGRRAAQKLTQSGVAES